MTRQELKDKLLNNHRSFTDFIVALNDHDFLLSVNEKWAAGQQLDHIYRSVTALSRALLLPKFVLRFMIAKANRPSRDFETLVMKYKKKLEDGGRAGGRFIPKTVLPGQKTILKERLDSSVKHLCRRIDKYKEDQLDYYILPHPLLGKLTLREMLYFTIYHVEHHHLNAKRNLGLPV